MKYKFRQPATAFFLILLATATKASSQPATPNLSGRLNFPFSEYVIRSDWAMPIVWKYRPFEDVVENETVIAPPKFDEDWNKWYTKMKAYQAYLRNNLNDTSSLYLQLSVAKGRSVRLHFKRVLNDMRLHPGNKIIFEGFAKSAHKGARFKISLIYIKIGQQLSHAIAKTENVATTVISNDWTSLHNEFTLPSFDTASLTVQPVVFFEGNEAYVSELQIKGLSFSVPSSPLNQKVYNGLRPSFYPASKAIDKQLYDRKEMRWVKKNFISGFAYLWDADFWDVDKKAFTVQKYCDKMNKAFEWEWQLAGDTNGDKFIFNEVWEWNESERFDGHNHFVDLRGGCAGWMLQTSDWYFPGTPNNKKPGGAQPLDSHCKYYIMKAGYDRAGTIGFRCLK